MEWKRGELFGNHATSNQTLYPRTGIGLGTVMVYVKVSRQYSSSIGYCEVASLQLVPKQQCCRIERNHFGHVSMHSALPHNDMFAGNLTNFIHIFNVHNSIIINGYSSDKNNNYF